MCIFVSLDITKAFDRINHQALLNAMKDIEMPRCIVKILANWWCKLQDVVMWNGVRSEAFSVGLGVPQGSLLEGKFFNFLMDRLLNMLQEKGLRCHVNTIFVEAVA